MAPGGVHEVRILNGGRDGTVSGYFDCAEKLARAAIRYDGMVVGIYMTLNPCNPALLARAANRLVTRVRTTTSDVDIIRRRWLYVDLDPVRPAGISSTRNEHGSAITTACGIEDDLRGYGFPRPVICDSGNGTHMLYRIDAPNNPEITERIKRILSVIAAHLAPTDVACDLAVFNAARIVRLYGTLTRKGDSTPDRPHRRSRILDIPDPLEVLTIC